MKTNRRSFLKQFGGTSVTVIASAALVNPVTTPATAQDVIVGGTRPVRKSYVTGRCVLELDGLECGWIFFAEGGTATAEVMEEGVGSRNLRKKYLGPVQYEEITLFCGVGLRQPFCEWIKAFLDGKPQRKSGAIVYLDSTEREVSRLDFTNALMTEVGFPALDTSCEEAGVITVKLRPESTRRSRDKASRLVSLDTRSMPGWLTSKFRLTIDGLAETASRINRIEAIGAKYLPSSGFQSSDLVITFPASAVPPIEAWYEDFVIKGNNSDAQEKIGKLEYLSSDRSDPLFSVSFQSLGIFRLEPVVVDSGNRLVHLVQARMYCENIKFDYRGMRA